MERTYNSLRDDWQMELIDGVPLDPRNCPPDYVRSLRNLQLHPDDVMVTSFPKSGKSIVVIPR